MRRLLMAGVIAFAVALAFVSGPTEEVGAQIGYQVTATTVAQAAYPLLAPNGTVGAPSYAFTNDATTGIYLISAGRMNIAIDGVRSWDWVSGRGLAPSGSAATPGIGFVNDANVGLYLVGADNIGMSLGGALVMDWAATNVAGAGEDLVTISATTGIMNSSGDIVNALSLNVTSADHTDGVLNALKVGTITGDTHSTESLFFLGDGYDYFINDVTDAALGTTTWTTNADKDAETAAGTLKVWLNGTLYHIQLYADS